METTVILKAIADETRMKIIKLLLQHNYCVRTLSRNIGLSEAAISQHLKILREANLLIGNKKGYFMHYDVNRNTLHALACEIEALTAIKREIYTSETSECKPNKQKKCHVQNTEHTCSD